MCSQWAIGCGVGWIDAIDATDAIAAIVAIDVILVRQTVDATVHATVRSIDAAMDASVTVLLCRTVHYDVVSAAFLPSSTST